MKAINVLLLLSFPFLGFSQIKLEPQKLFDQKIQISIPSELKKTDHPVSSVNDEVLFVNTNRDIILSITYPMETLNLNQFYAYKRFLIKGVRQDFPNIVIADSGVVKNNEIQIGFIECQEIVDDKTVYTSIYFTSIKGRLFKITLEYIKEYQDQWKNISKDILETLKVF